jgi:hypothetical protein
MRSCTVLPELNEIDFCKASWVTYDNRGRNTYIKRPTLLIILPIELCHLTESIEYYFSVIVTFYFLPFENMPYMIIENCEKMTVVYKVVGSKEKS